MFAHPKAVPTRLFGQTRYNLNAARTGMTTPSPLVHVPSSTVLDVFDSTATWPRIPLESPFPSSHMDERSVRDATNNGGSGAPRPALFPLVSQDTSGVKAYVTIPWAEFDGMFRYCMVYKFF